MKFDKLYQRAEILGCDHIATGHYARITFENGQYQLRKALDETKDQSYVLYDMTQQRLARTLFPLGELRKTEARDLAREANFINADKPDSQDICFVPDGDYAKIIELRTGKKSEPGNFVDKSGSILGRHNGIIRYTIGQHRGLGLSLSQKYYVCEIRPRTTPLSWEKAQTCSIAACRYRICTGLPAARRKRSSAARQSSATATPSSRFASPCRKTAGCS